MEIGLPLLAGCLGDMRLHTESIYSVILRGSSDCLHQSIQ